MDKFGLIGYPAAHSLSPELFREFCAGRWEYDIIETPSIEEAWSRFVDGPYKAVNVTAPFKEPAFERADIKSTECLRIKAANILVKTPDGIAAYNSDYLAVREMLAIYSSIICSDLIDSEPSIAVIGFGGAGKAALTASRDFSNGDSVKLFRHNEISDGVKADIIIYTLPKAVPGTDKLDCSVLIEANYKDPCLAGGPYKYVPGSEWLRLQAELGFPILLGKENFHTAKSF